MPIWNMPGGRAEESSQRNAANKGKTWRRVQEQEHSLGDLGNSSTMLAGMAAVSVEITQQQLQCRN